jgi:N6-L-threonylcarbamoyladenine synthase
VSLFLGLDTSNYCTSAALCGGVTRSERKLLPVPEGALGLRQSDAVFEHVRALPELLERLLDGVAPGLAAVGVSLRPRDAEGSYMPCFLAGAAVARGIAASHGIPCRAFSHQMGHMAAGAWSAGRTDLLDRPCLCWHVSGGTTELLYYDGQALRKIGGTADLNAGQLIDRVGVKLGLGFPAGAGMEQLTIDNGQLTIGERGRANAGNLTFSLSGYQNKAERMLADGASPSEAAGAVFGWLAAALFGATAAARAEYPGLPVLCVGGVFNHKALCAGMRERFGAVTARDGYSGDNAMGVALLAQRNYEF